MAEVHATQANFTDLEGTDFSVFHALAFDEDRAHVGKGAERCKTS